jgi:hypothetical protein
MFEQQIDVSEVLETVRSGEIIRSYPEDRPFPSELMIRFVRGRPLHVVASLDQATETCFVITAYWPDPLRWDDTFRIRRIR